MKSNYIVITRTFLQELVTEVNHFINQGYKPIGGISTTSIHINDVTGDIDKNGSEYIQYAQAMVIATLDA